jgi:nicotinamide-nucleotide adenylyltransferase
MMIGVYWGRFNPPHNGHMNLVKKILGEVDLLIIAIGEATTKNEKRNPFSGSERKRMFEAFLREEKLRRVKIVLVPTTKSFSESVKKLFEVCPKFDVLYTDKEIIIRKIKHKVGIRRIRRIGTVSATQIRDAIANDNGWEHLTGKSVAKIIKKINGIARIKKTYHRL